MELTHTFTVPGAVEETWARFQDIAALAECFPGAQVTSMTDDSFEGTVKVRLGPIALVYAGSGTFVSRDDAAHSFVVEAKGRDKRGNGTAGATVTLSMADAGGATDVSVQTDLSITGKPAQFGRGVMQDVSDKLLGQFVACLEERSAGPSDDAAGDARHDAAHDAADDADDDAAGNAQQDAAVDQDAGPASVPTGAAATAVPGQDQDSGPSSVPPPEPAGAGSGPDSGSGSGAGSPALGVGAGSASSSPRVTAAPSPPDGTGDDALDLGATVLPVLFRAYWRQAAAAVVGLLLVRRIVRMLRR